MLQQAFRKDKALDLQSELLAARYHRMDTRELMRDLTIKTWRLRAFPSMSTEQNSSNKGEMPSGRPTNREDVREQTCPQVIAG